MKKLQKAFNRERRGGLSGFINSILTGGMHKKEIYDYLRDVCDYINHPAGDAMISFPLPVAVIEDNGNILWYNKEFTNITEHKNLFGENIHDIVGVNAKDIIRKGHETAACLGRAFDISANKITNKDDSSDKTRYILYFIDKTNEKQLEQTMEENSSIICLLMLDNYDEVIQNTSDTVRSRQISEIEYILGTWAHEYDGFLRKYDRDKYIVVISNKNLDKIIASRFEILDKVRELDAESKIPFTLSIGIGKGGSMAENDKFACTALDMALGRGGDQVVIKDEENYQFFGAKSREVEKRTKVRARVVAYALKSLIKECDKVIITGHAHPDFDSIGASAGLAKAAAYLGKDAYIAAEGMNESTKALVDSVLKGGDGIYHFVGSEQAENLCTRNTLLIIVDTHIPSLVLNRRLLLETDNIVMIDHHRRGTEFLNNTVLTYHEPYASSTCEMVTEILQYIHDGPIISDREANALFAGIVMDTKNFRHKAGVRTFEAAAYLRRVGVEITEVSGIFKSGIDSFLKRTKITSQVRVFMDDIAISSIEMYTKDSRILAAQSADELLSINGIAAAFVLLKSERQVLISARSAGDINVQVIMEKLGGGGHMTAAGAQIDAGSLKEAEKKLEDVIKSIKN